MERDYEIQTTRDKVYVYSPKGELVARLCKLSAEYLEENSWTVQVNSTFEEFSQGCTQRYRVSLSEADRPSAFRLKEIKEQPTRNKPRVFLKP